ncbi:IS21 family transposase [Burkholderia sp. AU45388]|uniref:IS21 family transposase n=1 Tax=Burkholderia sp. AU45388 TaxID=3059206 RepID=UPI0026565E9D|nr:IS21 family transposase [Burkholderia sp. AU45388]MDN7431559.1 IS21 family transposase [Burkholderia sp. AU45388]
MFQYRQILARMRRGDSDRDIARGHLMGRTKLAVVRQAADAHGWLDPAWPMPDEAEIAAVFNKIPKPVRTCVSTVEPFRAQIRDWIAAGVQGTTIHEALRRNHGYTGSYSAVRRMVQHLSAERGVKATTILDFAPGDAVQVDFGAGPMLTIDGIPLKTWIFVMTLCWSRHQYAEIVPDQTVETWLACHRRAFEWFGGVPNRVIIDNAKCAIIRACRYDPAAQRSYAALAEGYGFRIDACPPRDPQKKGIVEAGVKYVKKSFVPLREFRDRADANRQLREWVMQQAGTRTHGTTQEQPLARFAIEKPLLMTLPDVPPKLSVWECVKLHRDGHVVYKYARYSAPYALVGKELWLKATDTVIQLFHRHELVATHPRRPAGGRHTVQAHQPPEAQAWLEHDPQWCLARAKEIGPSCHDVVLALFNDAVLVNLRGAQGLIRLREKFGDQRLDAACARALAFNSPKYRTVKGILDKGLEGEGAPKPATANADTYQNGGRFGRDLHSLMLH